MLLFLYFWTSFCHGQKFKIIQVFFSSFTVFIQRISKILECTGAFTCAMRHQHCILAMADLLDSAIRSLTNTNTYIWHAKNSFCSLYVTMFRKKYVS
jgi:hypothetical protein